MEGNAESLSSATSNKSLVDETKCIFNETTSKIPLKLKVLVTNPAIPIKALDPLLLTCEVHFLPESNDSLFIRYAKGMDGILLDDPERSLDREFFNAAGLGLKVISIVGFVGDQVDMTEAIKRKIKVGVCSSDLALDSSAEVAVGLALALCRRIKEGNKALLMNTADIRSPQWLLGQELINCTCGIVGLGKLGTCIAMRLLGFCPSKIIYYSRRVKKVGKRLNIERVLFEDLLESSDIIFLSLPCNSKTRGMFSEEIFMKMKRCAILINTSHGGLVKINDLYCALRKGLIFGAGIDSEITDAPSKNNPILKLDNFIILPSVSRNSAHVRQRMYIKAVENLIHGLVEKKMLIPWDPYFEEDQVETEEEMEARLKDEEKRIFDEEVFEEDWQTMSFEEDEKDLEDEELKLVDIQSIPHELDWT